MLKSKVFFTLIMLSTIMLNCNATTEAKDTDLDQRIVYGVISRQSGEIISGSGFTVEAISSRNMYKVIFDTPFNLLPTVTVTRLDDESTTGSSATYPWIWLVHDEYTSNSFNVRFGNSTWESFSFIAIGQ